MIGTTACPWMAPGPEGCGRERRAGFFRDIGIGHGRAKAFESRLRGRFAEVSGKIVAAQENAKSTGRPATKKTARTPESVASSESSWSV